MKMCVGVDRGPLPAEVCRVERVQLLVEQRRGQDQAIFADSPKRIGRAESARVVPIETYRAIIDRQPLQARATPGL
ncbi:MAG: hypothetical protein MJE77_32360 [Proteobacteria bacterium]|nr:hypothetical protein [Pseudomonadota bacterium]